MGAPRRLSTPELDATMTLEKINNVGQWRKNCTTNKILSLQQHREVQPEVTCERPGPAQTGWLHLRPHLWLHFVDLFGWKRHCQEWADLSDQLMTSSSPASRRVGRFIFISVLFNY